MIGLLRQLLPRDARGLHASAV